MVEHDHKQLSIRRQCELLGISRGSLYYKPEVDQEHEDRDYRLLLEILAVLKERPFYGYRKIAHALQHLGVTRKQVRRIMHRMGLRAIYPGKQLSKPKKGARKYPYLLKDKAIWLPNQVWAADITYIKLEHGYVYLVMIIDLYSRKILSWSISNTMDAQFCISALEEAISRFGIPAIFNTDQGSQFTSEGFLEVLDRYGIQISMDAKNRALDNIYIERFWRSLKYEDIYLKDYRNVTELRAGISRYVRFYNSERFHQSLGYATPDSIYASRFSVGELEQAA
jgi:putative transposase